MSFVCEIARISLIGRNTVAYYLAPQILSSTIYSNELSSNERSIWR